MPFETLKQSHVKRNIIIGVVVVAVIAAVILQFTRAKYRTSQSVPLINGTVNYSLADLNIVAIYVNNEQVDSLDENRKYTLDNTQSTCTYKDGSAIDNLTISYDTETGSLSISPFTTRGTKCTLYFNEDANPLIHDVSLSSTQNSITVTVNASDDHGITNYYYRINNGSYVNSTSNSYTFSNLTANTNYTIDVYVVDTMGNSSEVYTDSINTQRIPGRTMQEIIAGYNKSTRSSFSSVLTTRTTNTVYQTTDWDGTTYYFAGAPTDNWVYFGGYYWRIIRLNGDGTTRLIYAGTSTTESGEDDQIGTSAFNSMYNRSYYVGLSYNTTQHGTGTSSTILTALNNWYNGSSSGNLGTNYGSYIDSNAGFCSDREMASGSTWSANPNSTIYYAARERLETNKTPNLACNSNDILNIPVGLITADEVAYAGAVYGTSNTGYYLNNIGQSYWTMTPYYFNGSNARVLVLSVTGYFGSGDIPASNGVRPVINLKSDTEFTGTGTSTDSYVVVVN